MHQLGSIQFTYVYNTSDAKCKNVYNKIRIFDDVLQIYSDKTKEYHNTSIKLKKNSKMSEKDIDILKCWCAEEYMLNIKINGIEHINDSKNGYDYPIFNGYDDNGMKNYEEGWKYYFCDIKINIHMIYQLSIKHV